MRPARGLQQRDHHSEWEEAGDSLGHDWRGATSLGDVMQQRPEGL